MTVRATNLAFHYLRSDAFKAVAPNNHVCEGIIDVAFRQNMVEVQDSNIGSTTVNARMRSQVVGYESTIADADSAIVNSYAC